MCVEAPGGFHGQGMKRLLYGPPLMDPSIALVQYDVYVRAHFVENDNRLICDVIEFAWGHAVDYSIEGHATAFIHDWKK
jgi:hypothetical protein